MMMNNRMNNQQGDPRASLFLTSEKAVFCKIPVSRSSPIALHSPKSPKTLCWDLRRCFVSNQSEFLQRCESSEVILLAKWFAREKITTRDFFNIWQHIWKDNSTKFDNTWHYICQRKNSQQQEICSIFDNIFEKITARNSTIHDIIFAKENIATGYITRYLLLLPKKDTGTKTGFVNT